MKIPGSCGKNDYVKKKKRNMKISIHKNFLRQKPKKMFSIEKIKMKSDPDPLPELPEVDSPLVLEDPAKVEFPHPPDLLPNLPEVDCPLVHENPVTVESPPHQIFSPIFLKLTVHFVHEDPVKVESPLTPPDLLPNLSEVDSPLVKSNQIMFRDCFALPHTG